MNSKFPSYSGFATHYVPSHRLDLLLERLGDIEFNSYLDSFSAEFEPTRIPFHLIRKYFQDATSLSEIKEKLAASTSNSESESPWAKEQLTLIEKNSPTALEATFKLLDLAKNLTFKECLNLEYHLAKQITKLGDFSLGVTEKLIKKNSEISWNPLKELDFHPVERLKFFNQTDCSKFLHEHGLPFDEKDVKPDHVKKLGFAHYMENLKPSKANL